MGHISKKIVTESKKPAVVSLSGLPNFLELTGIKEGNNSYTQMTIMVDQSILDTYLKNNKDLKEPDQKPTTFTIKEVYNLGQTHTFRGVIDRNETDDKSYFIDPDAAVVAQNIRACLLKNSFFRNRFSIDIPFTLTEKTAQGLSAQNGTVIYLQSLGTGQLYNFEVEKPQDSFLSISTPNTGYNNDKVDGGLGNVDIEVEVYSYADKKLGIGEATDKDIRPGMPLVTMSKSYFGQPVWFDINALTGTRKSYSEKFLQSGIKQADNTTPTWVDAGTVNNYRLIARTFDGSRRETVYYSDILFTLTGYSRTLSHVDMERYIYDEEPEEDSKNTTTREKFRPLTNQPVLPHVKGQAQYFNFILRDTRQGESLVTKEYNLGIYYEFFSSSGKYIDKRTDFMRSRKNFSTVNTIRLSLDKKIAEVEKTQKVGYVKVYLCRNNYPVGEPIEFRIVPECLHKLNDFAFLNALGGWSSFNFEGEKSVTVKPEANTIYKTQLPDYTVSSQIESVFDKEIEETFSVKTASITAEVADWLKELGASIAVYELSTDRYVVIDDFNIKHTTKDSLFVLEMKYHYSDTYNAVIK